MLDGIDVDVLRDVPRCNNDIQENVAQFRYWHKWRERLPLNEHWPFSPRFNIPGSYQSQKGGLWNQRLMLPVSFRCAPRCSFQLR